MQHEGACASWRRHLPWAARCWVWTVDGPSHRLHAVALQVVTPAGSWQTLDAALRQDTSRMVASLQDTTTMWRGAGNNKTHTTQLQLHYASVSCSWGPQPLACCALLSADGRQLLRGLRRPQTARHRGWHRCTEPCGLWPAHSCPTGLLWKQTLQHSCSCTCPQGGSGLCCLAHDSIP